MSKGRRGKVGMVEVGEQGREDGRGNKEGGVDYLILKLPTS